MDKQRVGAILSSIGNTVYLIGYGTYEGDLVPPPELKLVSVPNPCIKLDSGKTVYGCECWWGDEAAIKIEVAAFERVVQVDLAKMRSRRRARLSPAEGA